MDLFNKRWNVRILALLHQNNGARFVVLKNGLSVNADSLTRNLNFLIQGGWVQRNPGYGHPLRPEYILTPLGKTVAPDCAKLVQAVVQLNAADTVYRKWSVPLLVAVQDGVARFNGFREVLDVTPRALTLALHQLNTSKLIQQQTVYSLTSSGSRIATLGRTLQ